MAEQQYFHDCLRGLAYTEEMCRKWCSGVIGVVHRKTSIELRGVLKCIIDTEEDKIARKGWLSAVLEHDCHRHPACNELIVLFLEKLPCASKLKRTDILKAVCQKDKFQFAKIFVKPWMRTFRNFGEMDAYCLFFLLEHVSVFHYEGSPVRKALYREHIGKIRRIAESCLHEDVKDMTKTDRNVCLQAVINALTLVRGKEADEVIHDIKEIIIIDSRNIQKTKDALSRRSDFKRIINAFHQEVIQSVSDFLHKKIVSGEGLVVPSYTLSVELEHVEASACAIEDRTSDNWAQLAEDIIDVRTGHVGIETLFSHQTGSRHYQLVKTIVDNGFQSGLEELFSQQIRESFPASSHDCTTLDKTAYIYFQVAVYYLENANFGNDAVRSLLEAMVSPDTTSDEKKKELVATLENALGHASSLLEIMENETKSTCFKVCQETILTVENDLRQYCKGKMVMIHAEVKTKFPKLSLCQLPAADGTDKLSYHPPAEEKFKHDCKKKCNEFLTDVLKIRSAKCKLTPQTMFRNVNLQDCLDNVWEFAKLFLEPCMHIFCGFEELDTFCLLTLIANVQMFDGIQSETETFLAKVCKARDVALTVRLSSKQELAKQTMESCIEDIVYILEKCIFPGIISQIKFKTPAILLPLSDISPVRQQRIQQFYEQDQKDLMKPVTDVRNRIMHCSSLEISQQEMDDYIDVILDMLRHIEKVQVGDKVTDAIKAIVEIKNGELKLLRDGEKQLLQEVKTDLTRKITQHEVLITMLSQTNRRGVDTHLDLWCRCALALKYVQCVWLPLVETEMERLYLKISRQSRFKLCPKANSKDITKDGNKLKFKDHLCTCNCNGLLEDIQQLFPDSDEAISMLRGSDPKTWLSSQFKFQSIFMKRRMRSEIKQFKDCDISALCYITKCCLPLKKKTDETLLTQVRSVRNTMVHCATMELSPTEMEYTMDVLLAFIRYLNKNITSVDISEANANIERLRNGSLTLLYGEDLRLLHDFVFDMKRELTVKTVKMTDLWKKISDMEQAISNFESKGTLSEKTFKDTGNDEGKPLITIRDWTFDRFTVVDQAELDRKWQEKDRRIHQMKEGIHNAERQLEKEKADILTSSRTSRVEPCRGETT